VADVLHPVTPWPCQLPIRVALAPIHPFRAVLERMSLLLWWPLVHIGHWVHHRVSSFHKLDCGGCLRVRLCRCPAPRRNVRVECIDSSYVKSMYGRPLVHIGHWRRRARTPLTPAGHGWGRGRRRRLRHCERSGSRSAPVHGGAPWSPVPVAAPLRTTERNRQRGPGKCPMT